MLQHFDALQLCTWASFCKHDTKQNKALWTTLDVSRGQRPVSNHWTGDDENRANQLSHHHGRVLGVQVEVKGQTGVVATADETCVFCQFTLHFIQQQLNDPKSQAEQCEDYIDAYGQQVIALIEQEIDPSVICP